MTKIPASVNEIDVEWIRKALCDQGLLHSSVEKMSVEPMGAGVGLMAEMARLRLSYAGQDPVDQTPTYHTQTPATLVAKCAAQNENREVARILDFYRRESDFYNHLSSECPLETPRSYFSAVDPESYDCVFIMEDLGEVMISDQVAGASKEQAEHSITAIAEMHGKWWNAEKNYPWAYDFHSDDELKKLRDMIYMPALETAIEKFSEHISEPMKKVMRTVGEHYDTLFPSIAKSNHTFIHGDYRLDNIVYESGVEGLTSKVLDWQISGKGAAMFDITYFLSQSLTPTLCGQLEKQLIEIYHDSLMAKGGADYSLDQCWQDYRLWSLFCLIYPVSVCGTLDVANDRGRQLATVMLERNLSAIERLESEEFLSDYW